MTFKKLHSFSTSLLSALALILVLTVVSCEKDDPTPEVQATCDDGIQNGDETGIDCGGSCSVCEEPVTMAAPDLNVAPIDMEETGYGPDFDSSKENNDSNPTGTWGVFGTDAANKMALSIVDNPNPTGNTSAHVLSIVEQAGQEFWQGFFFDLESKVAFSGTNTAISVDVHSVRAGQLVMVKLEDKTNASANTGEIIVATVGTGWETVVFNLSADYNGLFDRIVFIMDYGVVNDAVANHYMDNIRVSAPAETTGGGGGTYAPEYTGVFSGATKEGDVYTFPTAAETWAGFANENTAIYPLAFPNGGSITFTASSAGADVGVSFRFERLPHPDVDPAFNTAKATVSGTTATEYTIEIPAQDAANTFRSALMYLDTRDVGVTITNIEITVD